MDVPPQITFRGISSSDALRSLIEDKIEGLAKAHERINSCRVAVEKPHEHQESGNPYRVRVAVTVPPGKELVGTAGQLDNDLNDELRTVVIDAFDAVRRQLVELAERQRGRVKHRDHPEGLVTKLFGDEGYGFLRSVDEGREIYFHRNSVVGEEFDRLEVGARVRFVETEGREGPQASTVKIIGKRRARRDRADEQGVESPEGWGE